MYRGSRKHVLDWTDEPTFIVELINVVLPVHASVTATSCWMPRGNRFSDEALLEEFGPSFLPNHKAWPTLRKWWLVHERGANTPNWDIAVGCTIEERPGLILVEAKAHKRELKEEGKTLDASASQNSRENHEQIASAIREACNGLRSLTLLRRSIEGPITNFRIDSLLHGSWLHSASLQFSSTWDSSEMWESPMLARLLRTIQIGVTVFGVMRVRLCQKSCSNVVWMWEALLRGASFDLEKSMRCRHQLSNPSIERTLTQLAFARCISSRSFLSLNAFACR